MSDPRGFTPWEHEPDEFDREADEDVSVPCERCAGNGEIITDWDRYLHGELGDKGDEGTVDCPDCSGTGYVALHHPNAEGSGCE